MKHGKLIFVFALVTLTTMGAQAAAVKHVRAAAVGCIPNLTLDKAKEEIDRYYLKTINAKPEETRALGTGLFWLRVLNGGKTLEKAEGRGFPYAFTFRDGFSWSRQGGRTILISRWGHRQFGQNIAQLIHELGHYVGNNGAYEDYRAFAGGRKCAVSGYARKNGNEHFAEVFAAYVTHPALIKNTSTRGCKLAWEFFETQLFAKGSLARKCLNGRMSADQVKELLK